MLVGRLVASAAMLWLLLTRIPAADLDALWPGWSIHTVLLLIGALVFTLLAFVLSTVRWQQVLSALGQLYVFVGATVTPSVTQVAGAYTGTVSMTVTY